MIFSGRTRVTGEVTDRVSACRCHNQERRVMTAMCVSCMGVLRCVGGLQSPSSLELNIPNILN